MARESLRVRILLTAALGMVVPGAAAFAQSTAGLAGISGVVRDASGAAVPNARVAISNESKGVVRRLTTNSGGLFTAPALVPAPGYSIRVKADGFAPYEARNFELPVGQD